MGYSKEQLLARLKELQIEFIGYNHPAAFTVEDMVEHVGHLGGGMCKNLFLKDKKHRFYVVSALVGTNVDLKVLSQRLGLGKGGLRMAPEEALKEILQVPLGCVTPFALINESARTVSLLLDQGFKAQEFCLFHPLSNDMTISLNARGLDKFLISIGREPSYVDLEATPLVGKDQPPDLAALVPSGVPVLPESLEMAIAAEVPAEGHKPIKTMSEELAGGPASVDDLTFALVLVGGVYLMSESWWAPQQNDDFVFSLILSILACNGHIVKTRQAVTLLNHAKQAVEKPKSARDPLAAVTDVRKFVDEIIEKTSKVVLLEIQNNGDQLKPDVLDRVRKHLSSDLENMTMMFKNAAYTQGFHSGVGSFSLQK